MGLTKEEYTEKLSKLRKERDKHQNEAYRIAKEMDELESDQKLVNFTIGKFITIDRRNKGGYKIYFHVDSWVKRPRGVTLYGKGYNISDDSQKFLHVNSAETLYWHEIDLPQEITEDEFYNTFDYIMNNLKLQLRDYTSYKTLEDQFELKRQIESKTVKLVDIDGNPLKIMN